MSASITFAFRLAMIHNDPPTTRNTISTPTRAPSRCCCWSGGGLQKEDEVNAHLRDREHDQHDEQHRRPEELVADHAEGGESQPGRERQPDGVSAPECPASGSHVGGGDAHRAEWREHDRDQVDRGGNSHPRATMATEVDPVRIARATDTTMATLLRRSAQRAESALAVAAVVANQSPEPLFVAAREARRPPGPGR